MDDIIEKLKEAVMEAKAEGYEFNDISWGYQEGYLMSFNDLEKLVNYIQHLKNLNLNNY